MFNVMHRPVYRFDVAQKCSNPRPDLGFDTYLVPVPGTEKRGLG